MSIGMLAIGPAIGDSVADTAKISLYIVSVFIYFTVFFQLLIATLWGLYYLGERIHQA